MLLIFPPAVRTNCLSDSFYELNASFVHVHIIQFSCKTKENFSGCFLKSEELKKFVVQRMLNASLN